MKAASPLFRSLGRFGKKSLERGPRLIGFQAIGEQRAFLSDALLNLR
jgi:hypothetical protein